MSDPTESFHNLVYTGKVGLIITLLTLSIVNGHKDFVEKEPRKFLAGCLVFALLMGLSSAMIAANRKADWMSAMFITFLFFFFYAVVREFSGYYALMSGGKEQTPIEAKEKKYLLATLIPLAAILFGFAVYYVNKARVSPPSPQDMRFFRFPIELVFFIILGTAAEAGVGVQHGDKSVLSNLSNVVIYIIAHLFLQYGGFYDHVFAPVNWANLKVN
jgi:hypothetical protein